MTSSPVLKPHIDPDADGTFDSHYYPHATVDAALALKADQTALDAATTTVATKADQSALDATNTTVAAKADTTYVDSQDALKADQTALAATNANVTTLTPQTPDQVVVGGPSGGTVRVPRAISLRSRGALGNNVADDTAGLLAVLAAIPSTGGRITDNGGIYRLTSTFHVPTLTRLDGVPGGNALLGGGYTNGTVLKWAGATGGTVLSFFDSAMASARGVVVHGGAIANVVGVLIDSDNAPASHEIALEDFAVYQCGQDLTNGYGVRIGTSAVGATTQADMWTLRRGEIGHCDTGVSINSANAGYQGVIDHVKIWNHRRGIEVISSGNFAIRNVAFGQHTASLIADIVLRSDGAGHGGTGLLFLIDSCQTQVNAGSGWFLLVDSSCTPDTTYPVTLINNRVNDVGVSIQQTKTLILIGNVFTNCNVELTAGAPTVTHLGNAFNGTGMRNVTDAATTSGSTTLTSATANFVASDVGKRVCAVGSGPVGTAAPGIPQGTKIAAVVNSTTVTLDTAATATASGVSVRFDYGFVKKVGTINALT